MQKNNFLLQSNPISRSDNKGFTLIEVLVSLVLLGIAVTATMNFTAQNQNNLAHINWRDAATVLGQKKLFDLEQEGITAGISRSGDFGSDYPDHQWQVSTRATNFPQLYTLRLTIFSKINKKQNVTFEKLFKE